jgi:hypothetical protein
MPVPIQTAQMMVQTQIAQVIFRQWRISLNLHGQLSPSPAVGCLSVP